MFQSRSHPAPFSVRSSVCIITFWKIDITVCNDRNTRWLYRHRTRCRGSSTWLVIISKPSLRSSGSSCENNSYVRARRTVSVRVDGPRRRPCTSRLANLLCRFEAQLFCHLFSERREGIYCTKDTATKEVYEWKENGYRSTPLRSRLSSWNELRWGWTER